MTFLPFSWVVESHLDGQIQLRIGMLAEEECKTSLRCHILRAFGTHHLKEKMEQKSNVVKNAFLIDLPCTYCIFNRKVTILSQRKQTKS